MTAGIFISYRRDESRHAAGRLADDLAQVFGAPAIFRDIEGIDPGVDFSRSLERALGSCVVMLVLVGKRWIDIGDAHGNRRLDDPDDWIRQEIATALARDIRVIPVLLEGAPIPEPASLPEDLKPLVRRQAFELSDTRWRGDLQRLAEALDRIPELTRRDLPPLPRPLPTPTPLPTPAPASGSRRPLLKGIAIGAVGLLAIGIYIAEEQGGGPQPQPGPLPQPVIYPTPTPTPIPTPTPTPTSIPTQAMADLRGIWHTNTGEVLAVSQNGSNLGFTASANGMQIGSGSGGLDGPLLWLSMQLNGRSGMFGTVNCQMALANDRRSYSGPCSGPEGAFAAQLFR